MSKVVIIGGNKRAGKTTLSMMLRNEHNFNYFSFDSILDALESALPSLGDGNDSKYIPFLDELIEKALEDGKTGILNAKNSNSKNYGYSTVFDYVFSPEQILKLKHLNDVEVVFLANLDANQENIRGDLKKYSASYDWPTTASDEDIERNSKGILAYNELLVRDCQKYGFRLVNTSRAENRIPILTELANSLSSNSLRL